MAESHKLDAVTRNVDLSSHHNRTVFGQDIGPQTVMEDWRKLILAMLEGSDLPVLRIDIASKHLFAIENNRTRAITQNMLFDAREVPARINGKRVKIRLKGDLGEHWLEPKRWSTRVSVRKKESILGMQEFSIQKPVSRQFPSEDLFARFLKRLGVMGAQHEYARVFLNGAPWGVMNIEEAPSAAYLEKNEKRDSLILREYSDEQWFFETTAEPGCRAFYNSDTFIPINRSTHPVSKFLASRVDELRVKYRSINQSQDFLSLIDIDKYSRALIAAAAWGSLHTLSPSNSRHYLNPITGLLEPILSDQAHASPLLADHSNGLVSWLFLYPIYMSVIRSNEFFEVLDAVKTDLHNASNNLDKDLANVCSLFPHDCPRPDLNIIKENIKAISERGNEIFHNILTTNEQHLSVDYDFSGYGLNGWEPVIPAYKGRPEIMEGQRRTLLFRTDGADEYSRKFVKYSRAFLKAGQKYQVSFAYRSNLAWNTGNNIRYAEDIPSSPQTFSKITRILEVKENGYLSFYSPPGEGSYIELANFQIELIAEENKVCPANYVRHISARQLKNQTLEITNLTAADVKIESVTAGCDAECKGEELDVLLPGTSWQDGPSTVYLDRPLSLASRAQPITIFTNVNDEKRKYEIYMAPEPIESPKRLAVASVATETNPKFFTINSDAVIDGIVEIGHDETLVVNNDLTFSRAGGFLNRGRLILQGAHDNPIKISGESVFAGIASLGTEKRPAAMRIANAIIGRTEPQCSENYCLSGGVVGYHTAANITDTVFLGSDAEDALNFIHSELNLERSVISNTYSDALDLDFSLAEITNTTIRNIGGDALDFSGTRAVITGVDISSVVDKALSVGEKSDVTADGLQVRNAGIGVAVKDSSQLLGGHVYIVESENFDVVLFRKKSFYGSSSAELIDGEVGTAACAQGHKLSINGEKYWCTLSDTWIANAY